MQVKESMSSINCRVDYSVIAILLPNLSLDPLAYVFSR